MKCDNCGGHESVEPYHFGVYGVGWAQIILCIRCRLQFQVQLWRGSQAA